jgi:WD40 repeat protein
MAADLDGDRARVAITGQGRPRLWGSIWPFVAFVAVSLAGAAHLCGACCGKGARATGRATLVGHEGAVQTVVFGADNGMLGSVGGDGSIAVWDLESGLGRPLPPAGAEQGHCAAISPDGRLLAAGRAGGPVALHDLQAREEHALIDPSAATAGAESVAFAPDTRTLAVGQRDGRISLWDVAGRRVRSELPGHPEVVGSLAYAPDGRTLASSGGDRAVRLWDPATGRERQAIPGQPGMFVGLAFAPDSRTLALADQRSRVVRLWDLAEGAERPALRGAEGAVLAVAISPDGRTLAAADYRGSVHSWDLATGRLARTSLAHPGVQTLAFAPDGRTLATGGFDGTVHLWDWPLGQ